jgi:hypothetical protein
MEIDGEKRMDCAISNDRGFSPRINYRHAHEFKEQI